LLRHQTLTEDLEETVLNAVDDRCLVLDGLVLLKGRLREERPKLLDVDGFTVVSVSTKVETSHTNLAEVTRVVLVKVDSVVMLTTSFTTSTGMLSVLANTTVTVGNVTSSLSGLLMTEI
jgi:hypothetical protein